MGEICKRFLHSQKFTAVGFRVVLMHCNIQNYEKYADYLKAKTVSVAFRYLNI